MSVTVTDNARVTHARHYLADYELHHSQPEDDQARSAPPPNEQEELATPNPPGWETEWRRIPSYRPMQNLLNEQRDTTLNGIERSFMRVMFGGVYMMGVSIQHPVASKLIADGHTPEHQQIVESDRRQAQRYILQVQDWR